MDTVSGYNICNHLSYAEWLGGRVKCDDATWFEKVNPVVKSAGNVRHGHEGRRTEYAIETGARKFQLLGVSEHEVDIPQLCRRCFFTRLGKHPF